MVGYILSSPCNPNPFKNNAEKYQGERKLSVCVSVCVCVPVSVYQRQNRFARQY